MLSRLQGHVKQLEISHVKRIKSYEKEVKNMRSIVQDALTRNANLMNMEDEKTEWAKENKEVDAELEVALHLLLKPGGEGLGIVRRGSGCARCGSRRASRRRRSSRRGPRGLRALRHLGGETLRCGLLLRPGEKDRQRTRSTLIRTA